MHVSPILPLVVEPLLQNLDDLRKVIPGNKISLEIKKQIKAFFEWIKASYWLWDSWAISSNSFEVAAQGSFEVAFLTFNWVSE